MAKQRYKLTIAYDGTQFHGWQRQCPPDAEELRTVQGVLQQAMARTLQVPINLKGASRTDTGVHALGQVAHFSAELRIPTDRLAMAINARLPQDLEVRQAEPVHRKFDAIADVTSKQYRYRIWCDQHRPLVHRHYVNHIWTPLDARLMAEAAKRLIGEHDFGAFAAAGHGRQSTVRIVHDCRIETCDQQLHIVISGNGFLYNMVRIIAGTLVEIGRGRWPADYIDHLLLTADRQQAGPTLEPQGLCLEWIAYRPAPDDQA